MDYGLIVTREIAVRAILDKAPEAQIFGIPPLILLNFRDVRWVDYLPNYQKWYLEFFDHTSLVLWKLAYF